MEIISNLIQFNENMAVCAVTIKQEDSIVTLYGMGLVSESLRYAELAQARAIELVRQILAEGLSVVSSEVFLDRSLDPRHTVTKGLEKSTPAPTKPSIPLQAASDIEQEPPLNLDNQILSHTLPETDSANVPDSQTEENVDTLPDIPW
jgi:hypothetical protein